MKQHANTWRLYIHTKGLRGASRKNLALLGIWEVSVIERLAQKHCSKHYSKLLMWPRDSIHNLHIRT